MTNILTKLKTERKLSKTFNILAIASVAAILLGSITFFSEQAYSSDSGGNLVVHYDFEDGVTPTSDVSGHGNDGTLVGGATFSFDVPPTLGNTRSLDLSAIGTGDYLIKNPVEIAPTPFPSTDMTVAFWVKSLDSGVPAFLSYAKVAPGTNDVVIQNLFTGVEGCINNSCTPAGTPGILDGNWHHIAVTWQSSDGETKVYADGVPSTHTEATGTSIAGVGSLVLGQEQDIIGGGFSVSEAFEGLLDDVRIYDRVLTEFEVLALSTEGCSSGFYKNDAKKFGATQWTTYFPTTEFEFDEGGVFDDIATLKGKGNSDDTEPNLLEALNTRGSEHNALAREAVSALLNSQVGSGVDYGLTEAEVIILVNAALSGSAQDIEDARASLFALNHAGCPLLHGPKV